jgi:acetate kinase
MATTLLICPGATTKKYALFSDDTCVFEVSYTCSSSECVVESKGVSGERETSVVSHADFELALAQVLQKVESVMTSTRVQEITQVVLKVAVPGTYFQKHAEITPHYIAELKQKEKSAVRHVRPILQELTVCQNMLPEVVLYAASDSDFHTSMPASAREYSLSAELAKNLDIYKFGVHGLSATSVVEKIHSVIGIDPKRMVICNLGETVSVTAVRDGVSVDTSCGFATGTQAGDLDVSASLQIMKSKNLRPAEFETFMHSQGGLQAVAQVGDILSLFEKVSRRDESANKALELYVHQIQKAIAAATVASKGIDAFVFSGVYGVRSPEIRAAVLQGLLHLQVQINEERNNMMVGKDGVISQRNSVVKAVVVKGDEFSQMNVAAKKIKLSSETKNSSS